MNKLELVAVFMGGKWNKTSGWEFDSFGSPFSHCGNKLKFDTDWNWLMEVVKKIIVLCRTDEELFGTSEWETLKDALGTGQIEYVFEMVADFIEWYNENK